MDSVTEENVEKINREHEHKLHQLEIIKATTINQMWLNELNELEIEYMKYKEQRHQLMNEGNTNTKSKTKTVKNKTIVTL